MIPRFKCLICLKMVPWENGSWDCLPEACDDCWVEAHQGLLDGEELHRAHAMHGTAPALEDCR